MRPFSIVSMSETQTLHKQDRQTLEVQRKWPLYSGIIALVVVAAGGILIWVRQYRVVPYAVDDAWMNELYENRTPFWVGVAGFFNWLGGGVVGVFIVPLAILAI